MTDDGALELLKLDLEDLQGLNKKLLAQVSRLERLVSIMAVDHPGAMECLRADAGNTPSKVITASGKQYYKLELATPPTNLAMMPEPTPARFPGGSRVRFDDDLIGVRAQLLGHTLSERIAIVKSWRVYRRRPGRKETAGWTPKGIVGEALCAWRRRHGLARTEAAAVLNIDDSVITRIENEKSVGAKQIQQLVAANIVTEDTAFRYPAYVHYQTRARLARETQESTSSVST